MVVRGLSKKGNTVTVATSSTATAMSAVMGIEEISSSVFCVSRYEPLYVYNVYWYVAVEKKGFEG